MVTRLRSEYPDTLHIVELRCMAACDDVPAVMIEYDYYPRITPQELYQRIVALLADNPAPGVPQV